MCVREVAAGEGLSCPLFPPAVPLAMTAQFVPAPHDAITLGILAGGRATRLVGRDKAWLERAGKPLVLALARRLSPEVVATLVGANSNAENYLPDEWRAIPHRTPDTATTGGHEARTAASQPTVSLQCPWDEHKVEETGRSEE